MSIISRKWTFVYNVPLLCCETLYLFLFNKERKNTKYVNSQTYNNMRKKYDKTGRDVRRRIAGPNPTILMATIE